MPNLTQDFELQSIETREISVGTLKREDFYAKNQLRVGLVDKTFKSTSRGLRSHLN